METQQSQLKLSLGGTIAISICTLGPPHWGMASATTFGTVYGQFISVPAEWATWLLLITHIMIQNLP